MNNVAFHVLGAAYWGWFAYRSAGWPKWVDFGLCCVSLLTAIMRLAEIIEAHQ